ncbi:hypothetical protein [Desertivirga xinjiangensis]|uniref:hypothetical protein n=1 Tax=Desertivirga xinjiangensis TaxID=539206 RepID=UPI00210D4201|nr:hypothetical protein [Pedobacter xinjiangensis]
MKKLKILGALLCVLIASCQKEDSESAHPQSRVRESKFYYFDGTYYRQYYYYDASGQLVRDEDRRDDGALMSSRQYQYEANHLSSVSLHSAHARVAETKYIYEGDKLRRQEYFEIKETGAEKVFEQVYDYNEEVLNKITVNYFNHVPSYYVIVEYKGNNISRQKTFRIPENTLKEDAVFKYDNKINPFYNLMPTLGNARYNSVNNLIKVKTTRYPEDTVQEVNIRYEYQNNLPVKQFNALSDGTKLHEQTYSYERF